MSWRQIVTDLGAVLFPSECLGCGVWDQVVCDECLARLFGQPSSWNLELGAAGDEVLSLFEVAPYENALRRLILAGKHDDTRELRPYFQAAGVNLVHGVAAAGWWKSAMGLGEVFVVPAPSTKPKHPSKVAQAFSRGIMHGLVQSGLAQSSAVLEVLRFRAGVTTQAGLSGAKRANNRHGQMYLTPELTPTQASLPPRRDGVLDRGATHSTNPGVFLDGGALRGVKVVLVDDVTATGSTLREMSRVLAQEGAEVLAGFVVASTKFAQSALQSSPENDTVN